MSKHQPFSRGSKSGTYEVCVVLPLNRDHFGLFKNTSSNAKG